MTVTSKGQVTFPKRLLDTLGVKKGDRLLAKLETGSIVIQPAGKGILEFAGKLPRFRIPQGKTIDDLIDQAREEYFGKSLR